MVRLKKFFVLLLHRGILVDEINFCCRRIYACVHWESCTVWFFYRWLWINLPLLLSRFMLCDSGYTRNGKWSCDIVSCKMQYFYAFSKSVVLLVSFGSKNSIVLWYANSMHVKWPAVLHIKSPICFGETSINFWRLT